MSFNLSIDNKNDTIFSVILPCEPKDFGDFISGLLGKPQTIEKDIYGVFSIEKNDIINTYHLIEQRINQQNDASLIQFTAKIFYNDSSSVQINSIDDFLTYNEIKKVICTSIELSWIYLINFKNKTSPEKQEITISFGNNRYSDVYISTLPYSKKRIIIKNGMSFSIRHTERTWGVDLESLIYNHLVNLVHPTNTYRDFIHTHHNKIGNTLAFFIFACSIISAYYTTINFIKNYALKIKEITASANSQDILLNKIDFLLEISATGAWPRHILSIVALIIFSLIISIIIGGWVSGKGESRLISWILLTEESKLARERYLKHQNRNIVLFFATAILSIAYGVLGNILYSSYFSSL
ncbi:hypothetical protein [Pectobacterium aroidearum]|uniref:hypothetical protein n=1 Tax=Pectobacterium aroidearum TaxID=1201031 RepID=UPI001CD599FB|nr:hypothetical protein [Pectobacterium aroidearum]